MLITCSKYLVPEVGIEPTWGCPRGILSPVRLPVPPLRHGDCAEPAEAEDAIAPAAVSTADRGIEGVSSLSLFSSGSSPDVGLWTPATQVLARGFLTARSTTAARWI